MVIEGDGPMSVERIGVDLGERSYPIHIGTNLVSLDEYFRDLFKGNQVLVISNSTVAPLYMQTLVSTLRKIEQLEQIDTLELPDGEQYKHLETITTIYDKLLENKHSRTTTLIALGGGVIGDMVGFAAATYQRGVDFVQVPTTLLAQVDSSVGGKTGVNHPKGKNMIGAFYQPRSVIIDLTTLMSLSQRDYRAGISEVIKYGLIWDAEFFSWLEANASKLAKKDMQTLSYAVKRSCEIKAEVVKQDEREGGIRAILNLGHTFGHAIETATNYTQFLHGEAVAIGMVMAVKMSHKLGWLESSWIDRLTTLLDQFTLPTERPDTVSIEKMRDLMQLDKKVINNTLRLILLKKCGAAIVTSDWSDKILDSVLRES